MQLQDALSRASPSGGTWRTVSVPVPGPSDPIWQQEGASSSGSSSSRRSSNGDAGQEAASSSGRHAAHASSNGNGSGHGDAASSSNGAPAGARAGQQEQQQQQHQAGDASASGSHGRAGSSRGAPPVQLEFVVVGPSNEPTDSWGSRVRRRCCCPDRPRLLPVCRLLGCGPLQSTAHQCHPTSALCAPPATQLLQPHPGPSAPIEAPMTPPSPPGVQEEQLDKPSGAPSYTLPKPGGWKLARGSVKPFKMATQVGGELLMDTPPHRPPCPPPPPFPLGSLLMFSRPPPPCSHRFSCVLTSTGR